jgi:hypothetical protein
MPHSFSFNVVSRVELTISKRNLSKSLGA